jgi:hypothetical protein
MKYASEKVSGAMIYTQNFMKTGSCIQKVIRGIQRRTKTQAAW